MIHRQFVADRLRAVAALRSVGAWLYEDWRDIKHLCQWAATMAYSGGIRAAWWAGWTLPRAAVAGRIRAVTALRSIGAWLYEDWRDIKHLCQWALTMAYSGSIRAARWAGRMLGRVAVAVRIRAAAALRSIGAWLYEDCCDVKNIACFAFDATRGALAGGTAQVRKTGRSDAPNPRSKGLSKNPLRTPQFITQPVISGSFEFANAAANAVQRKFAMPSSKPVRSPGPKSSYRAPRVRGAVDRNRALLHYWRNKSIRYICSYATETSVREHMLNACVFLFGVAIAAGGYLAIQNYSENRAQTDFERPAREVVTFLTETIENHVAVFETAQRRFTAKRSPPNRWQFFQSLREPLKSLPGIQALEWVPRVPYRQRKRYEKRAVKDGLFGFKLFGPNGVRLKNRRRDYFPIYYVEPYPGNESALGFDLATDPVALEALQAARDSGKGVTTTFSPVDLAKSTQTAERKAPIIVVVFPVYDTEILPFTAKERQQRIAGFIRGVIRLDRMVQAYRSNLSVPPGLEVAFYSHAAGAKPRLRYHNPPLSARSAPLPYPKKGKSEDISLAAGFTIVDQNWSMVLRPESQLFLRNLSSAARAFAIFAILTTAILLLYLMTTQTRTRMIERSVTERTLELEAEIAQRKRYESELRAAKDEAVEANHAKSEFLAIMSHELRTPLNAITGFSEVMETEVYGPLGHANYAEYVSFIHDSADHLISLINDILDLSKIEAERYEIHKEEICLAEAWQPVEDMMAEQIAAARVTLNNQITNTHCVIRADDRALRQIFLNLLSNAVKFTQEGGRIDVWSEFDAAGRLLISVRDTGIGMSKQDLELVFEPFKQIESKVARKHKGTGLGLPLTQRLVALHGGAVEIDSRPGRGTTVRIILEANSVVADDRLNENRGHTGWGTTSDCSTDTSRQPNARAVDAA